MAVLHHHGHFIVISSYVGSRQIPSLNNVQRVGLIEIYDPADPIPWKIDRRLKNYKRLILCEDYLGIRTKWAYKMRGRVIKNYIRLASRFEQLWPLHIMCREWPLPREVYFEWPDHLQGLDQ